MTAKPKASRNGRNLSGVLKGMVPCLLTNLRVWRGERRRRSVLRVPPHILRDIGVDTSGMDGLNQRWVSELQARLEHDGDNATGRKCR